MAPKKKRRTKTGHPGVKIRKRILKSGYEFWFARFVDPDSGKTVDVTLDPIALPTREARRQWALRKSKAIAKRSAELASGAPKRTHTVLEEAIERYLENSSFRLRPRTMEVYRAAADKLLTWAEDNGIRAVENLTSAKLTAFRDSRVAQRKQAVSKGGRRGARKGSTSGRSPSSVNIELRAIKTMLLQWRSEEKLPNADRETITRCLKSLPLLHEAPSYLSPASCRKLLEAALRHDSEVFKITRLEHDGLRPIGSTPRYEPVAPLVLFLLLTGCRVGEAESVAWKDVDLEALDADGRHVGEITLKATATKTKRYRTIGLEVCPALRSLLAAMKLKSGGDGYVFGGKMQLLHTRVESGRKRLLRDYGAPRFSWQNLRQTTGTFLTNAPGIYGAASVFMSARQLGHSVAVAERHYLGVVRGIPREARTLESAMQIEALVQRIIEVASAPNLVLKSDIMGHKET